MAMRRDAGFQPEEIRPQWTRTLPAYTPKTCLPSIRLRVCTPNSNAVPGSTKSGARLDTSRGKVFGRDGDDHPWWHCADITARKHADGRPVGSRRQVSLRLETCLASSRTTAQSTRGHCGPRGGLQKTTPSVR
jgi:hypothetical protein